MFQESTFEGLKSFRESFVNTYKWKFYFTYSSTFTPRFLIWKKQQHFRLEKWKKKSPKQSIVQIGKFLILLLVVDYDLGRSDKGKTENQVVPALCVENMLSVTASSYFFEITHMLFYL